MNNSHRKKVLLVANNINYLSNFHFDLIRALKKSQYDIVTVAAGKMDRHDGLFDLVKHHDWPVSPTGMNIISEHGSLLMLYRIIKSEKPLCVLTFTAKGNIYGNLAARLANVAAISNISGLGSAFLAGGIKKTLLLVLYKFSLSRTSHVFFQNQYDRDYFSKFIIVNKSSILPGSGVNTKTFSPKKVQNAERKFSFLFVGRLIKDKGIIEYSDAAKAISDKGIDASFLVLGDSKPDNPSALTNDEFDKYIQDREIEYIGTTRDVANIINEVDCVVLPSYREGTPKSLLEAMSCGKPILTTNAPGCSRTVDHGINGLLCEVKSAKSLALQMERLLMMPDQEILEMGRQSRIKALREFDVNIVISEYIDKIRKVH